MTSLPLSAFIPCSRQHMCMFTNLKIGELMMEEFLDRLITDNSLRQAVVAHLDLQYLATIPSVDSSLNHVSISQQF